MLFDTHTHFDAEQFDADRDEVLSGLPARGVSLAVNPGCDIPSSRAAIALAEQYPFLYAAIGCHPHNASGYNEEAEKIILQYVKRPDSFVGCQYIVTIDTHKITFEIPERKINSSTQLSKLACAFELNDLFLIYVSTQQTFILPCRALTETQRQEFRRTLRERLENNFGTRFDQKKKR